MISRAAQLTIVVEAQNSLLTEPAPRAPQCALTSPPRMGPETSEVSALLAPFDAAHAYLRDSAGTLPSDGGTSSVGTASGCAVLTRRYAERDAGARTGAARRRGLRPPPKRTAARCSAGHCSARDGCSR